MEAGKHRDLRTVSPDNSFAYHQLDGLSDLSSLWKIITRRVENILQSLRVHQRKMIYLRVHSGLRQWDLR
jgi:hypothetical protein